jgi:DHA1 family inner membrane transport protein
MTYALDEKNGFPVAASGNMRRLVALAGGMFAIGTDSFVIAPLLPRIAEDLGVGVGVAAQLVTVYALTYAISSPLVATLTSRWAPERALIVGLAIFIVSNIGAAFAPDFLTVLLARCLAGLGAAVFAPMASATAAGLVPSNRRGFALSILMMGLSAATALGAPIGTLIGSFASWRTVFLLIALLAVIVPWGIGRSGSASVEVARIPLRERLRPLRNPMVLTNLLTVFLVLAGLYVSYTYISLIFDRVTHGDGAVMALLQSVWGVAGIAGAVIAGRLTDRLGSRVVIKIMLTVAALNFALLPFTSAHLSSAIVAIVIWGICGWGFVVPQQHRLIDFAPRSAPILLALYAMAVYGGTSVSGVLGAVGLEFMDRHQLPFIGVALILAAIVVQEVSHRRFKDLSYVT